jgi:hypothetical protein
LIEKIPDWLNHTHSKAPVAGTEEPVHGSELDSAVFKTDLGCKITGDTPITNNPHAKAFFSMVLWLTDLIACL